MVAIYKLVDMKQTIIIMTVAALLSACNRNDELFDSWKAWVAVNSGVTGLIEADYESDWYSRMVGDPSSLFYETETIVISMNNGVPNKYLTSNLWPAGTRIYKTLVDGVRNEYVKCINDGAKTDDGQIISNVIDRFITSDIHMSSDGVYYFDLRISKNELDDEEIHELGMSNANDTVSLRYAMDWLFKSDSEISTLVADINGMCGSFDDFCNFLNNSVTVVKSEKDKDCPNVYNVIYHIATDNVSRYSLCRILEKERGSELELVRSSDSLLNLNSD